MEISSLDYLVRMSVETFLGGVRCACLAQTMCNISQSECETISLRYSQFSLTFEDVDKSDLHQNEFKDKVVIEVDTEIGTLFCSWPGRGTNCMHGSSRNAGFSGS